jgi:hypothetical protein
LYLTYLNKNEIKCLFDYYTPKIKCKNISETILNKLVLYYLKNDIQLLLNNKYDVNKLNTYVFNYDNKINISFNNLSLLGYFIYTSIQYFFEITHINKINFLYDLIPRIFMYLIENHCDINKINYFPDNNIMSISSYVLIMMTNLNKNRLKLLNEKELHINTIKAEINNDFLVNFDFSILSNYQNTFNFGNFKKYYIKKNIELKKSKRKYSINLLDPIIDKEYSERIMKEKFQYINELYTKIMIINRNIEKIKRSLSILNWIFDYAIKLPNSLS